MSLIAHNHVAFNFECTPSFATWWEAKWQKKYEGNLMEAYDHLFRQLFFKSYPKNDELNNWKKMIHQKNQLLLIVEGHAEKVDVGPKEEVADALVLQEVAAKVARQGARSNHAARDAGDISELFGDSEDEAGPNMEIQAPRHARQLWWSPLSQSPSPRNSLNRDSLCLVSRQSQLGRGLELKLLRPLNPPLLFELT
ncbi:hypothetical protein FF1_039802 [Malus domestica]